MRVREPMEGRRTMCQLLRLWTPGERRREGGGREEILLLHY